MDLRDDPGARNGFTLLRVGAQFLLFGGGVYGEAYYNDVYTLRFDLRPGVVIPSSLPHKTLEHDMEALLQGRVLADCIVRGADDVPGFFVHRAVLGARCPALLGPGPVSPPSDIAV